jgi:hypothetical protein
MYCYVNVEVIFFFFKSFCSACRTDFEFETEGINLEQHVNVSHMHVYIIYIYIYKESAHIEGSFVSVCVYTK